MTCRKFKNSEKFPTMSACSVHNTFRKCVIKHPFSNRVDSNSCMVFQQEVYSTGPPDNEDGDFMEVEQETVHTFSYTKNDPDEDDIHEQTFMLRFLATNTTDSRRYLWVTDTGDVRTDGGYSNLASM